MSVLNLTVRNLQYGTTVIHGPYKIVGRYNNVTIPLSYIQANSSAKSSLQTLVDNGNVEVLFSGTTLTSTEISQLGVSTSYWELSTFQDTLATDVIGVLLPTVPVKLVSIKATVIENVMGASESMVIDVEKVDPASGTASSVLSTTLTVAENGPANVGGPPDTEAVIDTTEADIEASWPVQLDLTYTAGAGTGVGLLVTLGFQSLD